MSEQGAPGRYSRTFNGMAGAMIFIVGLVVLLVVFRALISDPPEGGRPAAMDYQGSVEALQRSGVDLVYPEQLPQGWDVTDVRPEAVEDQSYRINLYTEDDKFVGIWQGSGADVDLDAKLAEFVDEDTRSEDPLTGVGTLSRTWEGWSDAGGDHAYSTVANGVTVLVFGDVSADELARLVEGLGTAPVAAD